MKWLLIVLLTVFGQRDRDVVYERACVRLDRVTHGVITCPILEDWAERQRRQRVGPAQDDSAPKISNGF